MDALDVPYHILDAFSEDISITVLNAALSTVCLWYGADPESIVINHNGNQFKPESNKVPEDFASSCIFQ